MQGRSPRFRRFLVATAATLLIPFAVVFATVLTQVAPASAPALPPQRLCFRLLLRLLLVQATIQAAVDVARRGRHLGYDGAGTYNEQVTVSIPDLTIEGAGATTVIQPATGLGYLCRTRLIMRVDLPHRRCHTDHDGCHPGESCHRRIGGRRESERVRVATNSSVSCTRRARARSATSRSRTSQMPTRVVAVIRPSWCSPVRAGSRPSR